MLAQMANMQIIPAGGNVEAQYVEMMVPLYSYGCEKKVKKALSHLKGIYSVNVNCNQQKVTVWGICNKYDVLAIVKGKRRDARFWNPEDSIHQIQMEESVPADDPPRDNNNNDDDCYYYCYSSDSQHKHSLTRMKTRSLSLSLSIWNCKWNAWKNKFTRSHSF